MNRISTFFLLAAALTPAAIAQNMFRGNPARTGVYDTDGPRRFNGVKWVFKTEGWVLSSPALANGMAYVGSDDKNLYAIDLATGAQKWKFASGAAVRSSPAVSDGTVYFGSYDGWFYAVDAAAGKLKWKFETAGERQFAAKGLHGYFPRAQVIPDFWDFFLSSPAIAKDTVYFGSGDGHLYALDAASGKLKWKFATGDVVHSSPAVVEGVVFFGSWDSYFYALDAATGQEKWKYKTGEDKTNFNQMGIQSSPAVVNGVVYFGCRDAHMYALDAKTGQEKWKYDNHGTWINASAAVYGETAYVGASIPPMFRGFDTASGKARFELDARMPVFSSTAIASGLAYFGSFDGKLYAVDLKTGQPAWDFQTRAGRKDPLGIVAADGRPEYPAIFHGQFYEDMYRAGEKLFSLGSILSSPVVDRGVVYFGSTDGNLYALQ